MIFCRAGLSLGLSRQWRDALEAMTGERDLDASALLDYFKPLYDYLVSQNQIKEKELKGILSGDYEKEQTKYTHESNLAGWAVETDLGNKKKEDAQVNH